MASREERAKLRAQHEEKLKSMAKQPDNHATFDSEIPQPSINVITEEIKSDNVNATASIPAEPAIEELVESNINHAAKKTKTVTKTNKDTLKKEIKARKEDWNKSKVKAIANYTGDKKSVKIVAKPDDIKFWIKQSRRNGISQQDYLALLLLDTCKEVQNGKITDESPEVQEYQRVLRDMDTPVTAHLPEDLLNEIKDAAAELCMKQSGFYAFSLNRGRLKNQ